VTDKDELYLVVAAFKGVDQASEALDNLQANDRHFPSVVIIVKNKDSEISTKDVGWTPTKDTAIGVALGAVVGVLAGGVGIALGALGGLIGHHLGSKGQVEKVLPIHLNQIANAIGNNTSAIVGIGEFQLDERVAHELREAGADIYQATIPKDMMDHLNEYADENYRNLLDSLAKDTGGDAKLTPPYKRIFIVINPASGKPQPVLHVLNKVFNQFGVEWVEKVTRKYGDATKFAREAAESGDFDLVAGFGGDGTQHEIANGILGTDVVMGVLPGGTGNGFGTELGVPHDLEAAVKVLCASYNQRKIDVALYGEDAYFIQRLFTGIEPEEQTSREDKDKYGTLAYLIRDVKRYKDGKMMDIPYRLVIDGEEIRIPGYKCYIVNSGMAGTGLSISQSFKVDDGLLDVFMLSSDKSSTGAAIDRFFGLENEEASMFYWQGKEIILDANPDQPVWTDGEYTGRTPVTVKVIHKGLTVAVP